VGGFESRRNGVRKSGALRIGIVLLLATAAAGVFALVGRADDPAFINIDSSLQPGFVNLGQDVLYKAQWQDNDNRTFTHAQVQITVPDAAWQLVSSKPSGCRQNGTLITCPWDTLRFGDVVKQEVRLTPSAVGDHQLVQSLLSFYEGERNPGRQNRLGAPDRFVDVFSQTASPDKAGGCAGNGDHVKTAPGSGNSETDATAPLTSELCTPITIVEQPRTDPTQFCLEGRECVTDLVTTDAVETGDPIKLKLLFRGTGLNSLSLLFTSAGGTTEVPECTDPNSAGPDGFCWYDKKGRQQTMTWFVNWSGIDPIWDS
jgi:hypothetical protein